MVNRIILLLTIALIHCPGIYSQSDYLPGEKPVLPRVGIKSNLLYDATGTVNIGGELRLSGKYSLDVSFNLNAWDFADNKKYKHLLIQPEVRYWLYEPYNGHFFGSHLMWGHYNAGNIHLPFGLLKELRDKRFEGDLYGVGLSYGYQWILHPRLNLEATIGIGYMYLKHSVYECETCGAHLEDTHRNYFGPTKLGLSLIYIIK